MNGNRRAGGRELSLNIGDRIRVARQAAGLSQGDLAKALERTRASISMWESGDRTPSLDDLYDLAFALDRPVSFLLPREAARGHDQASVTLRAVATRLTGTQLGPAIEEVLQQAAALDIPAQVFKPRSRDPIEAAQELLSAIAATKPPINVEDAATALGARLIRAPLETDALSGFLVHLPDGPVIAANAHQPPTRQRFTIAHELAHIALAHHADFHIDLAHAVSGDPPGYDWRQERAANTFAANLLMPAGWVRHDRVEKKLSFPKLASRYDVSGEAMGIRLETLGLR